MSLDPCVPKKDQKERQNPFFEVISAEKKLWALIHSEGLLPLEAQDLYHKARAGYEKIILNDGEEVGLQDVEYSLWKLHYKHIDEFRKRIRQTSANTNVQGSIDCHTEHFKLFLSDSTEFYRNLIIKLRRCYGLPEEPLFSDKDSVSCTVDGTKFHRCQYSCHRFLVCLGDLARYGELCKKLDYERHNWSVAASYYFKAALVWPDSGNPQNQLALLATSYVGDDFLALYHCIRSLAVKEPFPDAWDNLILLFEKNRSSRLDSLSKDAHFDFSNPSERTLLTKLQSSSGSLNNDTAETTEKVSSTKSDLWPLFVRIMSFFFIESSFEEFPCTFASTMTQLDSLLALDDTKLKSTLESYQQIDSSRAGPYRALQMVSVLIFIIHSLSESSDHKELKEKNNLQQPLLIQSVFTATFICMGRLVDRCLKGNNRMTLSPLLPAVLVFVEWLVGMLDKLEKYGAYENVGSAISYFINSFVELLNQIDKNGSEFKCQDHTALWEDYELRGFAPVAYSHESLEFTTDPKLMGYLDSRSTCRVNRIFHAAMTLVGRSYGSRHLIFYDDLGRKFYVRESRKLTVQRGAEAAESNEVVEPQHRKIGENGSHSYENGKSSVIEEEEVILFRPITRYNSAPIYTSMTDDEMSMEAAKDQTTPSDESLRRATSLFVAQNQAQIGNFRNKPFKQHEPLPKDTTNYPSGPPSLSAWVLHRESSNIDKERGTKDFYKPGLSPIEEVASASLTNLSIRETEDSLIDSVPPPYSAPVPSAPLLPDDAIWLNSNIEETNGILGASTLANYTNLPSTHEPFNFGYQPVLGMSSSEWLYHYTNQNLGRASGQVWPVHLHAPGRLGGYLHGHDGSRLDLFDRWGNPLSPNGMVFLESPQLHPGSLVIYGADEQRSERLLHSYQSPSPHGCGGGGGGGGSGVAELRGEQPALLQYLKEREWQFQQQSQVRGPVYMGN